MSKMSHCFAILVTALIALTVTACGPRALEAHARTVVVSHDTLDVAGAAIEAWAGVQSERAAELGAEVEPGTPEAEQAIEEIEAMEARVDRVADIYRAARVAHRAYASAVLAWAAGEGGRGEILRAAVDLLDAWRELAELVEGVPPPPGPLARLAGDGQ